MGLDMYLEATFWKRSDKDPRVAAVFKTIDTLYPDGTGAEPINLCIYSNEKDPKVQAVRDSITVNLPVAYTDNAWIGGEFDNEKVTLPLGYWRKSNQIHAWFVANVQGGHDDCQTSDVPREKLFELRKAVKRVNGCHSLAPKILPTQAGFFFGDTGYSEYYFEDIKHTLAILDRIADKGLTEQATIHYHASW